MDEHDDLTPEQHDSLILARRARIEMEAMRRLAVAVLAQAMIDAQGMAPRYGRKILMRECDPDTAADWIGRKAECAGGFAWWCRLLDLDPRAVASRYGRYETHLLQASSVRAKRTHCARGHELEGDNVLCRKGRTTAGTPYVHRVCRECNRERTRAYWHRVGRNGRNKSQRRYRLKSG